MRLVAGQVSISMNFEAWQYSRLYAFVGSGSRQQGYHQPKVSAPDAREPKIALPTGRATDEREMRTIPSEFEMAGESVVDAVSSGCLARIRRLASAHGALAVGPRFPSVNPFPFGEHVPTWPPR